MTADRWEWALDVSSCPMTVTMTSMTLVPTNADLPATTTADLPATTEAGAMLDENFGLALMDGEQVLVAGRPQGDKLMRLLMLNAVIVALLTGIGVLFLPLIYLAMRAYVAKHRFWVTNSRVVVTNGVIGFRARSIPLERVSDVAIRCTVLERMLGIRSVVVRDMTGEAMSGATMLASADATALQRQILDRVHEVNRRAPSADGERMLARGYREIEHDHGQADMLELLRRIEANTRTDSR